MRLHAIVVVSVLVGCTERNPKFCGDGTCTDPSLPFCDTDGRFSDTPGTCIAVTCNPGEFAACRDDDTLVCNSDGNSYDVMHCDTGCKVGVSTCNPCKPGSLSCGDGAVDTCGDDGLPHASETCLAGCVDSPAPHCAYLEPKYLPDVCDLPATEPSFEISSSATLSTDLDANCNGGIVPQDGGPELCVLRYGSISIPAGVTLAVSGARAFALVADQAVDISGTLDVSGSSNERGPGGSIGNAGNAQSPASNFSGGGGGGFATAGGSGQLPGGSAVTNPSLLTGLIGGSDGSFMRNAGGAAMLVSCHDAVTVSGIVDAGGGGGFGATGQTLFHGPTGGGSGGNVVLQGLDVVVSGKLFANGGGGAGVGGDANGASGHEGTRSSTPAVGGRQAGAATGGDGGAGFTPPTNGGPPVTGTASGAGGGSVGFLQSYTPAGVDPMLAIGSSPAFQQNLVVPTR